VKGLGYVKGVNDDDVGGARHTALPATDKPWFYVYYAAQSESSKGSSRWSAAGVTAFHGGPIAPVQGCDLCNTDVTQSPWTDNTKVFGGTINWDTGKGVLTVTDHQFNRDTGFTFDSTPVLVSFDVPVPAETLEPREVRVNAAEVRYASALDFPVNFVAGAIVINQPRISRSGGITTVVNGRRPVRSAKTPPRRLGIPRCRKRIRLTTSHGGAVGRIW
jgi:hypothetical protein